MVESKSENGLLFALQCGWLIFYITKEDLAARRFDRIWLVLQCY